MVSWSVWHRFFGYHGVLLLLVITWAACSAADGLSIRLPHPGKLVLPSLRGGDGAKEGSATENDGAVAEDAMDEVEDGALEEDGVGDEAAEVGSEEEDFVMEKDGFEDVKGAEVYSEDEVDVAVDEKGLAEAGREQEVWERQREVRLEKVKRTGRGIFDTLLKAQNASGSACSARLLQNKGILAGLQKEVEKVAARVKKARQLNLTTWTQLAEVKVKLRSALESFATEKRACSQGTKSKWLSPFIQKRKLSKSTSWSSKLGKSKNIVKFKRKRKWAKGWSKKNQGSLFARDVSSSASTGSRGAADPKKLPRAARISLRSQKSGKLCADERGKVICNRDRLGSWEKYSLADAGHGKVALRGGHFRKNCADDFGKVVCNRARVRNWEKFTVEDVGGGKVALKGGRSKKYCSDKGDRIVCDRTHVGKFEMFTVQDADIASVLKARTELRGCLQKAMLFHKKNVVPLVHKKTAASHGMARSLAAMAGLEPMTKILSAQVSEMQTHIDEMGPTCKERGEVSEHLQAVRDLILGLDVCPDGGNFKLKVPASSMSRRNAFGRANRNIKKFFGRAKIKKLPTWKHKINIKAQKDKPKKQKD